MKSRVVIIILMVAICGNIALNYVHLETFFWTVWYNYREIRVDAQKIQYADSWNSVILDTLTHSGGGYSVYGISPRNGVIFVGKKFGQKRIFTAEPFLKNGFQQITDGVYVKFSGRFRIEGVVAKCPEYQIELYPFDGASVSLFTAVSFITSSFPVCNVPLMYPLTSSDSPSG